MGLTRFIYPIIYLKAKGLIELPMSDETVLRLKQKAVLIHLVIANNQLE